MQVATGPYQLVIDAWGTWVKHIRLHLENIGYVSISYPAYFIKQVQSVCLLLIFERIQRHRKQYQEKIGNDQSEELHPIHKITNKVYHIYKRTIKHICYKHHMKTKRDTSTIAFAGKTSPTTECSITRGQRETTQKLANNPIPFLCRKDLQFFRVRQVTVIWKSHTLKAELNSSLLRVRFTLLSRSFRRKSSY